MKIKILRFLLCLISSPLMAYQGSFTPSVSDWGGVGLLQMPTARFYEDGELAFGPTRVTPHTLINFNFQFLPWLQPTLRYVITDDRWGKGLKNYDRSLDLKFLLVSEGSWWPQIALGFQDALGTPHFRSEFLVFSKRYYDLDFTLGLGWGRLGSRGHFKNVFGCLNSDYKKRIYVTRAKGGTLGFKDFFRGDRMAAFGGVEYSTPLEGLNLKVEYNSNKMDQEKLCSKFKYKTPWNFGASYQVASWLQLRAGFEQGHQFMFGGSIMGNFHKTPPHPKLPIPPVHVRGKPMPGMAKLKPRQKMPPKPPVHVMAQVLYEKAGTPLVAIHVKEPLLTIYCENKTYRLPAVATARIARILTFIAPENIDVFKIVLVEKGMNLGAVTVLRRDVENMGTGQGSPEEVLQHTSFEPAAPCFPEGAYVNKKLYPNWKPFVIPRFKQTLFDPSSSFRFQVILAGGVKAEPVPGLLTSAEVGINVYNNLDSLMNSNDSKLPHVRSDVKRYATEGRFHLAHLQIDRVKQLSENIFGRISGGFFESMFAGYSGELLYRPYYSPCAFGVEINHVYQRDFNQLFGFKGYDVTTGHVSFYCDLPIWNLHTNLHLGRYLAKDWGGTIEVSRRFDTGIEVGFFTTHTNVPHHKFGEGSYDKGVWFKIPFDFILGGHLKQQFKYLMRPLSKDGGQRLIKSNRLYDLTNDHTGPQIRRQFGHFAD